MKLVTLSGFKYYRSAVAGLNVVQGHICHERRRHKFGEILNLRVSTIALKLTSKAKTAFGQIVCSKYSKQLLSVVPFSKKKKWLIEIQHNENINYCLRLNILK